MWRNKIKTWGLMNIAIGALSLMTTYTFAQDLSNGANNFYKSDKVTLKKVTFKNQYHMDIVGNLFMPKEMKKGTKMPAIVIGHPMGAVKEQSSNLYATKLAEQGFVTLAVDVSFRPIPFRKSSMTFIEPHEESSPLKAHRQKLPHIRLYQAIQCL